MSLKNLKSILSLLMLIALILVPAQMALAQDGDEPEATEEPEEGDEVVALEVDETLGTEDNPIILLFIPSEDAQEVATSAEDLAALITEETDLVFETLVSSDFAAAIEAMCSGEAQIGALNTFGYILAHQRGCADVGVVSVRFGSAYYAGQIITLADAGIESYEDLAGTVFCRPDPLSTSGWIIPSIALQANGVDLEGMEIVDAGGHDGVVTAVYNGECDAGATFEDARSTVEETYPDVMDKVVVIDVSAPIPNDTLSYSPMLSEDARTAITEALVAIAADEANLELLGAVYDWSGLEPAEDAFFDDFREQLDAAGVDIEDLN
ncbi:MAG TPA: phosphate/phosphite/phosphonate ABC transporter substrate-binding protein [Aggregatilineales bacterium]|nr:phosphate/phosphite/phosphonate ABC transporter substrate-binding protein [Aggregatilineales bacterium]